MVKKVSSLKSIPDFINFFGAIPDSKWCVGLYTNDAGQHCALGHLGRGDYSEYSDAEKACTVLSELMGTASVVSVNDGSESQYLELGSTPKERIINYLTLAHVGLTDINNL